MIYNNTIPPATLLSSLFVKVLFSIEKIYFRMFYEFHFDHPFVYFARRRFISVFLFFIRLKSKSVT